MGAVVVDDASGEWGEASATFSPDRRYRYLLTRTWDPSLPTVNFVMLNPSTADAFVLDPTNRRCVGFARSWGFGSFVTTNVFAWRSTDPKGLRAVPDPVGPLDDGFLVDAARGADLVLAAWGVHAVLGGRGDRVRELFAHAGIATHALRITKQGHPGHPLYVPATAEPIRWP